METSQRQYWSDQARKHGAAKQGLQRGAWQVKEEDTRKTSNCLDSSVRDQRLSAHKHQVNGGESKEEKKEGSREQPEKKDPSLILND